MIERSPAEAVQYYRDDAETSEAVVRQAVSALIDRRVKALEAIKSQTQDADWPVSRLVEHLVGVMSLGTAEVQSLLPEAFKAAECRVIAKAIKKYGKTDEE